MQLKIPIATFFLAVALSICAAQDYDPSVHIIPRVQRELAEPTLSNEKPESFKVDVGLVLIPVTVTDRQDRLVLGLEKDRFSVYEGSNEQVIRHFSFQDAPVSLGIVFDTSSSMYGKMERSREAVVQLMRSSNPDDEFFLIGFANRPELLVDFTSSVEAIQDGICKASPDGLTALIDAVYLGLHKMQHARNERRVLLIISDGGENHSRYNVKDLWSVVMEAGVQIYAMGIFDEAPRTKGERMGPDLLSALTKVTGGRTFSIHRLNTIEEAAGQLAIELRHQYLIGYHPKPLVRDGKWHRVGVRVSPPQNSPRLRVYAKVGYYAPVE